jgi:hypothetical protein
MTIEPPGIDTVWRGLGLTVGLGSLAPLVLALTGDDPVADVLAVLSLMAVYAAALLLAGLLALTLDRLVRRHALWLLLLPLVFAPLVGASRLDDRHHQLRSAVRIFDRAYGD